MAEQIGRSEEIRTHLERRGSERVPLVVRIDYTTVDALFSEFTRNVNEGGLFIETESPPDLDARVALRFTLPGSPEPIGVSGRVVRVADGAGGEPTGVAIEFESLDSLARERIDELVRSLRG